MGDASLDLEGVASDGDDGPPQALAGSVVGGVGAMDTLAVGAQGAAPVAEVPVGTCGSGWGVP